ncbi:MAG TPA: hypothetical protein ENH95_04230 [Nitrosopumilus sp.]|nr:hypothetical protein [Nitrosopumilus sp.]
MMYSRIWVSCTCLGSSGSHAFYGSKPIGVGTSCPSCGSSWQDSEIVASSLGKSLSVTMGNVGSDLKRGMLKIIWLEPQSGKA